MNTVLAIPVELRLIVLFLLGSCLGGLINWATYQLAFHRRTYSPWGPAPKKAAARTWLDCVPILGWLRLRREKRFHGPGHWVRPLVVELTAGAGVAWLYWWEVVTQALYPEYLQGIAVPAGILHSQFAAHVILITLMTAASLIDIDEKLIPPAITDLGTLLGLLTVTLLPWSLLPHAVLLPQEGAGGGALISPRPTLLTAPQPWPENWGGFPHWHSLAVGLGCYALFLFAVTPRPWYPRHGLRRAVGIATARFCRSLRELSPLPAVLIVLIAGGIAAVWYGGGLRWAALLSALVGMSVSGGMIWAVRIIGAVTLRREAMGFGDVLLMMMIGAFVGWQAGLMIFFIAPCFGLVIGVLQLIIKHDDHIPYGPFLCLGALAVIVFWADFWQRAQDLFALGWLIPAVIGVCLIAMAVILLLLQGVKRMLGLTEVER